MADNSAKRIELGFLTNGAFSDAAPGGAAEGHKDAVDLFRIAEQLGYQRGWLRNRHFDNYVSSPLPVLAAASQVTTKIKLGTAIIPVGYEHPIRLAEDAATVDLLADGRLELGLAGGIPTFQSIFHPNEGPWEEASQGRVSEFLAALAGKVYGTSPAGDDYVVRPKGVGLLDRVWYGPGSVATATRAAEQGMDLLLSAIGPNMGLSFEEAQLAQIQAHRAAWTRNDRRPRVSAARLFFPALNDSQRGLYQAFSDLRASGGPAAARPQGALNPTDRPPQANRAGPGLMSPVFVGDPAEVIAYLKADVAVAEAGELMIFLPPNFTHRENVTLLEAIATHVAPALGWSPA